jgi:hypothetical protein
MKAGAFLLVFTLLMSGCASAPPVASAAPESDEFRIEATVLAMYNVISGPAGRHDWRQFKELFAPDARLIETRTVDGAVTTTVRTPDEYATATQVELEKNSLFEHPVATRVERFRDIAQVFSAYEARHQAADETPYARGSNSIQLVRSGDRWLIQTVLHEEDAAPQ